MIFSRQDFMEQLSTEECRTVIVETFLNQGGIELLRSMLAVQSSAAGENGNWHDFPNNQPLPSWCNVGDVERCQLSQKMFAAGNDCALQQQQCLIRMC